MTKFDKELRTKYDAITASGNFDKNNKEGLMKSFNPEALDYVTDVTTGVGGIASTEGWLQVLSSTTTNGLDQLPQNLQDMATAGKLTFIGLDFSIPFLLKGVKLWKISGYTNTAGTIKTAAEVATHIKEMFYVETGRRLANGLKNLRTTDASSLLAEYNNIKDNELS